MIKKILFAALAATSAIVAVAPAAATTSFLGVITVPPSQIRLIGEAKSTTGTFGDFYQFTLASSITMSSADFSTVRNVGANLDFTRITLFNGLVDDSSKLVNQTTAANFVLTPENAQGSEGGALGTTNLAQGSYTIYVAGNVTAAPVGYTGNVNFSAPMAAVPEPATWGMMIMGFGLIGAASRRSRRVTSVLA